MHVKSHVKMHVINHVMNSPTPLVCSVILSWDGGNSVRRWTAPLA
jgi:hypothetical protein